MTFWVSGSIALLVFESGSGVVGFLSRRVTLCAMLYKISIETGNRSLLLSIPGEYLQVWRLCPNGTSEVNLRSVKSYCDE